MHLADRYILAESEHGEQLETVIAAFNMYCRNKTRIMRVCFAFRINGRATSREEYEKTIPADIVFVLRLPTRYGLW